LQRQAAEYLLLLDTGDALVTGDPMDDAQGQAEGQLLGVYHPLGDGTQGEAVVAGMNLMGYDAMALGPKELTLGVQVLRQRMSEAEFAILSGNVVLSESGELLAPAYTVIETGPLRLGVLGITRPLAVHAPGVEVEDPQAAIARWLPEMADQADLLIVLTNLIFRDAMNLVATVPGVDLLVAALPGQLPGNVVRVPGTSTLAVTAEQPMARHSGRRVGELRLVVGGDAPPKVEAWKVVPMDSSYADDLEMKALLENYQ
jgi:2',3'-cyclic-nucleotide 2'-phosphodiesterase (5'-nucleotidase family)